MVARHGEHLAVRIAGMIHESCWGSEFLAVDDVDLVVIYQEVEREEI